MTCKKLKQNITLKQVKKLTFFFKQLENRLTQSPEIFNVCRSDIPKAIPHTHISLLHLF